MKVKMIEISDVIVKIKLLKIMFVIKLKLKIYIAIHTTVVYE